MKINIYILTYISAQKISEHIVTGLNGIVGYPFCRTIAKLSYKDSASDNEQQFSTYSSTLGTIRFLKYSLV